ncbi:MAG: winged helix-turn-helix transcriptional regulator, partial [Ktedonobacteraceae bacterium]|nr:winged helix-turn-helix transcriptional regulator [Ktedonobacteraceae bacterium]
TDKMLTQQLRELEADGLITRKVYPVVPPKVEYTLSAFGKTLEPVIAAIATWGETHEQEIRSHVASHDAAPQAPSSRGVLEARKPMNTK